MLYNSIAHRQPIDKGWSGDQKNCVVTADGTKYLLRITSDERAHRFHLGYLRMQEAAALGVSMCLPVEFGQCPEGTYAIHSWVEGVDAEEYIPTLPVEKQYTYGLDAGRILRKLHTLPAPADVTPWSERFNTKIDRKIKMYDECPLKYENGHLFLSYLADNRYLLSNRPQSYQHGDYHIGNMMIDRNGVLTIIDFDRDDYGDPWEEFNRIVWCAQAAPAFASGMVDGYFNGDIPMEFWKLLALYICSNTLSSLPWAIPFGDKEIQVMRQQAAQVLQWYDGMKNVVPTWYQRGTDLFMGGKMNPMDKFTVSEMQEMQKQLQEKYKDTWEPICAEIGQNKLLWMIGEIGEVIDIVKKHGGEQASSDPDIRRSLIEEMADVLMYFNDVMLCYGITEEELRASYIAKFKRNMERW